MDTLDEFTIAYIECALWATNDNSDPETDGEPLDANYSTEDIAPDTLACMVRDCAEFQKANAADLVDYPAGNAGHDFWLTREGHGAGFWEVNYGTQEQCERLDAAAKAYGEFDLHVADDGFVHNA